MKFVLGISLMMTTICCAAAQTASQERHDGNWLQNLCREADRETVSGEYRHYLDAGWCMGYINGMLDGWSETAFVFGHAAQMPCVPTGASYGQLVKVVLKYLDDHPERLHMDSTDLVILAINTAFPCPTDSQK